jgi:hypothetical protein
MNTIIGKRTFRVLSVGLFLILAILISSFSGAASAVFQSDSVLQTSAPNTSTPMGSSGVSTQSTPINHLTHPGAPPAYGPTIMDVDSSVTAAQHYPPSGDIFNNNLYERPFNANTQDTYFPQVDILQSSMVNGSPWVYGSITLKGIDPSTNQLDGSYALELDLNMDGRGDLLVVANNPAQGDWSTDGVQVFVDANHDVGGNTPLHPDVAATPGDGYEQKVFDAGVGTDPDLAWSMVSAIQPNVVWIAFKSDLINNTNMWMWGAWAQNGGLHPELFDYNDHFTLAEAGNPMPGNANYPLKALAGVDSTCRWAIGFTPTGSEPGLCALPATAAPFLPTFTVIPTPTSTANSTLTPTSSSTPAPSITPEGPTATRRFIILTDIIRLTEVIHPPFATTPVPTKPILRTPTSFGVCIPAFKCTRIAP